MIETLLTLGWLGNFNKLRKAAIARNPIAIILYKIYVKKHQSYIPLYCSIADDVYFPHLTGINIAGAVKIGAGCTIYQNVTIGSNYLQGTKHPGAPVIGDNVLIGANAVVLCVWWGGGSV